MRVQFFISWKTGYYVKVLFIFHDLGIYRKLETVSSDNSNYIETITDFLRKFNRKKEKYITLRKMGDQKPQQLII